MKSILKNLFRIGLLIALIAPAAQLLSAGSNCCYSKGCGSCSSCDDCFNNCSDCSECGSCYNGHTYWTQREQDAQYWLTMAMSADKQHKSFDNDEWYNVTSLNAGYERSFNGHRISSYFFDKNGSLTIGPDNAVNGGTNNKYDVRSSDLGLPAKLVGRACLDPRIANVYVNFDWYTEWNQWVKGLNTWINIPFVHTQWNIRPEAQTIIPDTGDVNAPGVYYLPVTIGDASAAQATAIVNTSDDTSVNFVFTGKDAVGDALLGDTAFGDAPALKAGKIKCCNATASGLSGIRFGIGYDFVRKERGNMGLGLDIVAPAANKPAKNLCCCNQTTTSSCCGCGSNASSCGSCCDNNLYYFMPSIGSQHAWKVGGLLRGQYIVWDKADDHNITMYLDGRAYGVINAHSTRMLGLKVGGQTQFNHWILLKKYNVSQDVATYVSLERAANLLSAYVTNATGVEGQATIMFTYKKGGFTGELGYNFFGRRAECKKCFKLCNEDATNDTYRYVINGPAPVIAENAGAFDEQGGFYNKADTNISMSGTVLAISQATTATITSTSVKQYALDFSDCGGDIDTSVAMHPAYIAHTIFGSLGYTWVDADWTPSLGVIGKVELGNKNTSLRTWGVFVEGGLAF